MQNGFIEHLLPIFRLPPLRFILTYSLILVFLPTKIFDALEGLLKDQFLFYGKEDIFLTF